MLASPLECDHILRALPASVPAPTTALSVVRISSSREQPHGYNDPFPVQEATIQVAYPLQPAIFVTQ